MQGAVTTRNVTPAAAVAKAAAALASHWPEYVCEFACLGLFMLSACSFGVLLGHPDSPLRAAVQHAFARGLLGGLAMGLTALAIFLSPWGKRSGAHINPAVTLSFLWLRKIGGWDAFFYTLFQFLGGIAGVLISAAVYGEALSAPPVSYVVTRPGPAGVAVAFAAEFLLAALMLTVVLQSSNSTRLARFTPFFAASLVTLFITFEAPLSGMSINPARTLGSAVGAQTFTAIWIYFTAPVAGMLFAAALYRRSQGLHRVFCAKLHHHNQQRCIFRCRFGELYVQQ